MSKIVQRRGPALVVLLGLAITSVRAQDRFDSRSATPEQYRGQVTDMRILFLSEDLDASLKRLRDAIVEARRVHSIGDGRAWARLKRAVKKVQILVDKGAKLNSDSEPTAQTADPAGDDDSRLAAAVDLAARAERLLERLRKRLETPAPSAGS